MKGLEKRNLIKQMKSVSKGNKKVWMLYDVEPSAEVTGGLTGTQNFDLDTLEDVMRKVEATVRKKGTVTRKELLVVLK